jgi:hypothetical protein
VLVLFDSKERSDSKQHPALLVTINSIEGRKQKVARKSTLFVFVSLAARHKRIDIGTVLLESRKMSHRSPKASSTSFLRYAYNLKCFMDLILCIPVLNIVHVTHILIYVNHFGWEGGVEAFLLACF